eukprot:scaffold3035_cov111-Isochrysis_galbana.AAC.10
MSISSYVSDSSAASHIRTNSVSQTRPVSRAWFSPSFKRCSRPCTPPVRLFSVYSLHAQPSIRQSAVTAHLGPREAVPHATSQRTFTGASGAETLDDGGGGGPGGGLGLAPPSVPAARLPLPAPPKATPPPRS